MESQSATELTRGMFEALKTNPAMGRSEALRRSMFKLAANDNNPHWAHPAFWAPFVVVGEGARDVSYLTPCPRWLVCVKLTTCDFPTA